MSPEEQKVAMEQHAGKSEPQVAPAVPQQGPPPAVGPPKAPADPPRFDGVAKGFLEKGQALYGDEGSPEGGTASKSTADSLFDSLVASTDPDFANLVAAGTSDQGEDGDMLTALSDIAKVLSGEGGGIVAPPLDERPPALRVPLGGIDDQVKKNCTQAQQPNPSFDFAVLCVCTGPKAEPAKAAARAQGRGRAWGDARRGHCAWTHKGHGWRGPPSFGNRGAPCGT